MLSSANVGAKSSTGATTNSELYCAASFSAERSAVLSHLINRHAMASFLDANSMLRRLLELHKEESFEKEFEEKERWYAAKGLGFVKSGPMDFRSSHRAIDNIDEFNLRLTI
jgi:hypothetical protein